MFMRRRPRVLAWLGRGKLEGDGDLGSGEPCVARRCVARTRRTLGHTLSHDMSLCSPLTKFSPMIRVLSGARAPEVTWDEPR